MKVPPATVAAWRKRFMAHGLAGLHDKTRSGKPRIYVASELRERILRQLELPAPDGQSSWDGATLAQALGVSDDAIWRILRKEGIELRRLRSWCVSTDPEFAAKAADVIGLYPVDVKAVAAKSLLLRRSVGLVGSGSLVFPG